MGIYILVILSFKKSYVKLTNKRIEGTMCNLLLSKEVFSYRLDVINNVSCISRLGMGSVVEIDFTQGNNYKNKYFYNKKSKYYHKSNVLPLEYVVNAKTFCNAVNNLLMSVKNDIDVQIDIEMDKINIENRKVEVLEKMVENKVDNSNSNLVAELKGLKSLLDEGILTIDEFNKKKSELLNK